MRALSEIDLLFLAISDELFLMPSDASDGLTCFA